MTFLDAGDAARILCAAEIITGIVAFLSVYLPEEDAYGFEEATLQLTSVWYMNQSRQ